MNKQRQQKKLDHIIETILDSKVVEYSLIKEVEQSFLDYSMSVITARALPDVRDGLKPVHRRIMYTADEEGLTSDKKFKKSAALVGTVMGSYHPHGDSSIYEALVRLAQDFAMRYPLIEGQGNFGSVDGDGAAAMRYTESRLSKIGDLFLENIKENTVDFVPNYDGTKKEPVVLPTYVPNVLVNGSTGIAVGLATNIPPHNLNEISDALLAMLKNPDLSVDELCELISGPDFPTGGIVLDTAGIREYLATGRGSFYNRSLVEIEENDNRTFLIVKQIPYAVNKTKLIEKIVRLAKPQKGDTQVPEIMNKIADIRDESSRDGIRLIIEVKKGENASIVLNSLFKHSHLQQRFSVNLTVLIDQQPKTVSVLEVLKQFVAHQINVLVRKTQFNLDKVDHRIHILEGRKIVAEDILNVVKIIAEHEEPEQTLQSKYKLSDIQVQDIVNQPLKFVKRIEVSKLVEELKELNIKKIDLEETLASKEKQKVLVAEKVTEIKKRFGDARRTFIDTKTKSQITKENLIPIKDVVLTLSQQGYVKYTSIDEFRAMKRGNIGVKGNNLYDDDNALLFINCSTHDNLLFFSNFGKVYRKKTYEFPETLRTGRGKPIYEFLQINKDAGEKILSILPVNDFEDGSLLFATVKGIIKKTAIKNFSSIFALGKKAIVFKDDDQLMGVIKISETADILLASSTGKIARIPSSKVRAQGRNSMGVKGMKLSENEQLISLSSTDNGNLVFSVSVKGIGKLTEIDKYRLTNRNTKGTQGQKLNQKTGNFLMCIVVDGTEDVLLMSNTQKINRFNLGSLKAIGRNASGIILFRTKNDEELVYANVYKDNKLDEAEIVNEEFELEEELVELKEDELVLEEINKDSNED